MFLYVNEPSKPAYYAVIPSYVRYCEELKYPERLLYGEITALTGKGGYCFAQNKYFAELYNVIPGTISRWITHLEKLGFVKVEIIKNKRNQIMERRIYINDRIKEKLPYTYEQNSLYPYKPNSPYPYEQDCLYPISRKAKDNNINIKIDRFFHYIIKKEEQNPEKFTEDEERQFFKVLERLEFNYTEKMIAFFSEENLERLKIIIYALKELFKSNRKQLLARAKRDELIFLYDNCKERQANNFGTENEIDNFFNYYCASMLRDLEKN